MSSATNGHRETSADEYDYIVVGGGIAGSVLASRLHEYNPSLSILLVEAGKDATTHPLVPSPLAVVLLHGSELDWNYTTVPQKHLGGRTFYEAAGKALGGGSVTNYGLWTRADAVDYDAWANLLGDSRWSYQGLLPYFRKSEQHQDPEVDLKQHGRDGPVPLCSVSSSGRNYPLRDQLKSAWISAGVDLNLDANSGSSLGIGEAVECRINGSRLIASEAYSLKGVKVMTDTLVKRVLIKEKDGEKTACGVELADGRTCLSKREIVLSAGAYRTPQILLLSGVGSATELARHGITQVVDAPEVGQNLYDHMGVKQFWRLRHPDTGAAVGSSKWTDPAFQTGNPLDYVVCHLVSQEGMKAALSKDEGHVTDDHPLLKPLRCHVETAMQYAAVSKANPVVPLDGTHVSSHVMGMLPTSRGSVTLESTDPAAAPIIDMNYYGTEADRYVMREGLRKFMDVIHNTPAGQAIIASETVPEGFEPLTASSTDEQIDKRVAQAAMSTFHPAGTAAMGKVVDSELRVFGVAGLRVCDGSVMPLPVAGHPMAAIYAIAEQAADIMQTARGVQ